MTKAYQYGRPAADFVYCVLLDSGGLTVSAMNATKIGLVVIAIERYVKVTCKRYFAESTSTVERVL